MSKVKSILCVTSAFPDFPGERDGNYVHDSLEALVRAGVRVSVIVCRPFMPGPVGRWLGRKVGGIPAGAFGAFEAVESVRYLSFPRHFLKLASNASLDHCVGSAIVRLIGRGRFDLIHGHGEELATAVASAARAHGLASFVTIHGIDTARRNMGSPAQRRRYRNALRALDRVILVGESLRSHFSELVPGEDNFCIVHNGFRPPPPELCNRSESQQARCGLMELISVSNLNEGKGVDVTLEALALLRRRGCDRWRYRIVGDGEQRAALERQTRRLGLGDVVRFLGARPHAEIYPLLAGSDVFVLPSYREAFGIAYLEAMAMGLLAVGVRGQGPEAFVIDGRTGILVPPHDEIALGCVLERAVEDRKRCREIASRGRVEALTHWTWDCHATALTSVYDQGLGERVQ